LRARDGHPGEKVLLEPIGIVGYRAAGMTVLDEVGLVTPAVAQRRTRGPGWYVDIVAANHPEWLAMRKGMMRSGQGYAGVGAPFRSPAERESLLAGYAEVDSGMAVFGDEALVVRRRTR
jgi:hypothetical protein